MKVLKGYVFRLYSNVEQKTLINKTIGSARLIYNIFLRDRIDAYNNTKKGKSAYDQNIMIPSLLVKYPFLKEVDSCSLRNASSDLEKRLIKLPKLKWVKVRGYRNKESINGRIRSAVIRKDAERYYVSILVEEDIYKPMFTPQSIMVIIWV